LLALLSDLLLRSRAASLMDLAELAADFRNETGRRVFALGLQLLLHRRRAIELASDDAFEMVLFLLNSCLAHMDVANAGDCLTGRVIVRAAHKIFRRRGPGEAGGGEDHVYNYVRDHELWRAPAFWEEDFWFREVKRARTQVPRCCCCVLLFCCCSVEWPIARVDDDVVVVVVVCLSLDHVSMMMIMRRRRG
jgi:hypothetical protein